jgi:hypothetical protein
MKKAIFTFLLFTASITFAYAQEKSDWETTKKQLEVVVNAHDCSRVWNLTWPWARSGVVEARAFLAGGMHPLGLGLIPPGTSDSRAIARHFLILTAYGAVDGDRAVTEMLHEVLRMDLVSDMGGKNLKSCLDAGKTARTCVDAAVKEGFLPDFKTYAKEIETATASGLPVSCKSMHDRPENAAGKTIPISDPD